MPLQEQTITSERERQVALRRQQQQAVDGVVIKVKALRSEIEAKALEFQQACVSLEKTMRRFSADSSNARYKVYVTSQSRLGGTIGQAIKRATQMDRLLDAIKVDQVEEVRREDEAQYRQETKAAAKRAWDLQLPREDDFEMLYGDITDAS